MCSHLIECVCVLKWTGTNPQLLSLSLESPDGLTCTLSLSFRGFNNRSQPRLVCSAVILHPVHQMWPPTGYQVALDHYLIHNENKLIHAGICFCTLKVRMHKKHIKIAIKWLSHTPSDGPHGTIFHLNSPLNYTYEVYQFKS